MEDFFGYTGSLFILIFQIPQIVRVLRTKKVQGISMLSIVIYIIGNLFSLVYGVLINQMPVILISVVCSLLAIVNLYFKIKYEKPKYKKFN